MAAWGWRIPGTLEPNVCPGSLCGDRGLVFLLPKYSWILVEIYTSHLTRLQKAWSEALGPKLYIHHKGCMYRLAFPDGPKSKIGIQTPWDCRDGRDAGQREGLASTASLGSALF